MKSKIERIIKATDHNGKPVYIQQCVDLLPSPNFVDPGNTIPAGPSYFQLADGTPVHKQANSFFNERTLEEYRPVE